MNIEVKEELKERVLGFIQKQPGYDANNVEEITINMQRPSTWSILYGESVQTGITGIGDSPDHAFDDFIIKWKSFKGFEWIKKTKILSGLL